MSTREKSLTTVKRAVRPYRYLLVKVGGVAFVLVAVAIYASTWIWP